MVRQCPVCQKKLATKAGLKQHMEQVHRVGVPNQAKAPSRRRRRNQGGGATMLPSGFMSSTPRGGGGANSPEGTIVLSRADLVKSIDLAANSDSASGAIPLLPSADVMPWLYKLATSFDQIQWHSARVYYKPAVGTTFAGSLVLGVDWNADADKAGRNIVQACTPVIEAAAWQPTSLTLPPSRLQSRRYYFITAAEKKDAAPGALLYNLKASKQTAQSFVGDIWLEYRVSLLGPSA